MANLSKDDKDALDLYVIQLTTLLENPIAKGKTLSTKISVQQKGDGTAEINRSADLFDDHQFKSFMTTFRQMIMQGEVIIFGKICDIIWQHCDREEIKKIVSFSRKQWNDFLNSKLAFKFIGFDGINENTTNRQLLDLWMYSGIFHVNPNCTVGSKPCN